MPPFSWSKSRDGTFRTCLRQYYYAYYLSRDASATSTDPFAREILIMSRLQSRPMWIGSSVHAEAHRVITGARMPQPPSSAAVSQRLRRRMEADWHASSSARYRDDPRNTAALSEHYYGHPIGPADLQSDLAHADRCTQNVYHAQPYQILTADPSIRILEAETLARLNLAGLTVWVVLDLAMRLPDGSVIIVDWKTGSSVGSAANQFQLGVYALYASRRWAIPADAITTWEVGLADARQFEYPATSDSLAWVVDTILQSASQMRSLLRDPARNLAHESDFPMTEDLDLCRYCNFRRACSREVSQTPDNPGGTQ